MNKEINIDVFKQNVDCLTLLDVTYNVYENNYRLTIHNKQINLTQNELNELYKIIKPYHDLEKEIIEM